MNGWCCGFGSNCAHSSSARWFHDRRGSRAGTRRRQSLFDITQRAGRRGMEKAIRRQPVFGRQGATLERPPRRRHAARGDGPHLRRPRRSRPKGRASSPACLIDCPSTDATSTRPKARCSAASPLPWALCRANRRPTSCWREPRTRLADAVRLKDRPRRVPALGGDSNIGLNAAWPEGCHGWATP